MASRTMKERHHAKGGKAEKELKAKKGPETLYDGQGSPEAKEEEDEKDEFKKGGHLKRKHGGKAEGKEAKERGDRKPRHKRAAGGRTPFSTGHETHEPKDGHDGHESSRP